MKSEFYGSGIGPGQATQWAKALRGADRKRPGGAALAGTWGAAVLAAAALLAGCNSEAPVPFDLQAMVVSDTLVRLSWKAETGGAGNHYAERSVDGQPYQPLFWLGVGTQPGVREFSREDAELEAGREYCYRVATQLPSGRRGRFSEPACARTGTDCGGLPTPFDLTAVGASRTETLLTWKADTAGAGNHYVERSLAGGPFQPLFWLGVGVSPGVRSFSHTDGGLQLGVEYCYRVATQAATGARGCFSETACASPVDDCNGLPTPFDVQVVPWGKNETRVRWKGDPANLGAYYIERARGGPFQFQPLVWVGAAGAGPGVTAFQFIDLGVEPAIPFCYRIASQHTDGRRGCFSEPVCGGTVIQ